MVLYSSRCKKHATLYLEYWNLAQGIHRLVLWRLMLQLSNIDKLLFDRQLVNPAIHKSPVFSFPISGGIGKLTGRIRLENIYLQKISNALDGCDT
jgi:hypothetical protein